MLFCFLTLLVLVCGAQARSQRAFKIEGQKISFNYEPKLNGWISQDCFKSNHDLCEALSAVRNMRHLHLAPDDLRGGKNPGSVTCLKSLGEVRMAKFKSGSTQSFCAFKDGSIVDAQVFNFQYNASRNGAR